VSPIVQKEIVIERSVYARLILAERVQVVGIDRSRLVKRDTQKIRNWTHATSRLKEKLDRTLTLRVHTFAPA